MDYNELWKVLEEMKVTVYLTYHQRKLCVGQEATVRTLQGKTDWFKIGKGIRQSHILSCAPKSLRMVTAAMKLKDACSLEEKL